ncbi:hypothetical protein GQ53DRAFT_837622 [Thozetella sp. PMI_491]|nr:hypothetical protein GQ53DRAFT_837622 [Thozetella sp. PMI_491]
MADNVANRGPQLLAVDLSFLVTAIIASVLRCYVRTRIVKAWGVDDWLMLTATISFTLYCACSITGVHYGTGRHHADLALADIQQAKKYWWCCYLFYSITMIASKFSIGWFLLRIAVQRVHRIIIYISCLLTGVTGLVFFFVTIFQCSPVNFFWNQYEGQSGRCVDVDVIIALAFLYSGVNVFVDFSFALLPAFLLWGLQLDKKTKIATIPLLAMGCVASGGVVARLAYLMNFRNPDFLWATLDIAIWSTVEEGLAITAGSLAALRPLLKRLMVRFGWSRPSEIHYNATGNSGVPGANGNGSLGGSKVFRPSQFELVPSPTGKFGHVLDEDGSLDDKKLPPHLHACVVEKPNQTKAEAASRTGSQEGLWSRRDSSDSLREVEAGVVVTKSWRITVGRDGN